MKNQHPQTVTPRGAATFHVACGIFAAVAVAQGIVAATGRGVVGAQPALLADAGARWKSGDAPSLVKSSTMPPKVRPENPLPTSADFAPAEKGIAAIPPLVQPSELEVESAVEPVNLTATLDTPITDEGVLMHLDKGLTAREKGDMITALEELRAAHAELPDHPKLIFQLAETLDLMGLHAKSLPYWESLASFGEASGEYFFLARKRLEELSKRSAAAKEEREGRFTISEIEAVPEPAAAADTKLTFRFAIKKNFDGDIPDITELNLAFHFFDLVNDRGIDRSITRQPEPVYLEEPVDWADGSEKMEIAYDLGVLGPEEIKRYGKRKYYGYAFEIYYKDKLQDLKAQPAELSDFAREMKVPEDRSMPDLLPGASGLIPQPPTP